MLDVLNVTPTLGIAVLQPNKCRTDVSWNVLHVVNNNGLFAPSWHENFDSFVVIAVGSFVQRALNALVRCLLTNLNGFRKLKAKNSD